jgi:hypothetical protein
MGATKQNTHNVMDRLNSRCKRVNPEWSESEKQRSITVRFQVLRPRENRQDSAYIALD